MKNIIVLLSVLCFSAGCAKPPSKIAASAISSSEYADLSCSQIVSELGDVSEKLGDAERRQRTKVATDAGTVFLTLIPLSTMSGDNEAEVARYKGEKNALQRAMSKKDC